MEISLLPQIYRFWGVFILVWISLHMTLFQLILTSKGNLISQTTKGLNYILGIVAHNIRSGFAFIYSGVSSPVAIWLLLNTL